MLALCRDRRLWWRERYSGTSNVTAWAPIMSDKAGTPQSSQPPSPPVPPDERFWQRYSPHGEAPLSFAGSFTLHLLVGGVLFLLITAAATALAKTSRSLPVEPVRLKINAGGGGHKQGEGGGQGVGNPKVGGDEMGE